nr:endopeptidase La [Gemmatimonadaceae bacterium]
QLEESGLKGRNLSFDDDALMAVISRYTRESGVRQLERQLGAVARKIARRIAAGDEQVPADGRVDAAEVRELLGRPKVHPEHAQARNEVGIATGMYYTPMGGDIMFVEASIRRRDGQRRGEDVAQADAEREAHGAGPMALILTGQLGDVMKESARAALTYATNNGAALGVPAARMRGMAEAHIHVPAGAIPKDGPSAGIAIATALVSEMSGVPVRRDVAMTGEITLRGRVLPIGGVKEKVLGAHRAGITTVIVPRDNEADLFHPVSTLEEVLAIALVPAERGQVADALVAR